MASTHLPTRPRNTEHQEIRLGQVPEPSEVPDIARRARKAWELRPRAKLDLRRICGNLGIEVSVVSLEVPEGGAQGFLIPRPGGFLVEIDPEPRGGWQSVPPSLRSQLERHRKRFLIAHELTHTLFYEDHPTGPRRLVPDSPRQESFCDELARTLLVPLDAAAELPFDPQSAVEIQRRFDVSMEVALRGLVAAHRDAGAAWLLLQESDETLVQWTSADRRLTAQAMRGLRGLANRATKDGHSDAALLAPGAHAWARYLPGRAQVIVTCRRFASNRPPD